MAWASAAVRAVRSRGFLGEQVLGKIASKMMVIIMLFFQSLARGRVDFDATGEHTSGVEAGPARNGDSQVWSRRFTETFLVDSCLYSW